MIYVFILFFLNGFEILIFFLILTISWTTFIRIQRREFTDCSEAMKSDDPWVNGPGASQREASSSQVVPQDPRLFTATVWENIALGLGPVNQAVAMEGRFGLERTAPIQPWSSGW